LRLIAVKRLIIYVNVTMISIKNYFKSLELKT